MSLNTTRIHPYAPVTLIEPFWNLAINTGSVFFCTGSSAKAVLLPPAFSTSTAHLNNQPIDVSKNGRKIFFYLSKSQERFYFPVQFHPLFLSGITGNKKLYRAEKREGDVPVALYYNLHVCIFHEGTISVFPLAQGPPLPLALHMRVATSQELTFKIT